MPRSYPDGFGKNLLAAYENHIRSTAASRRDLRFKPQFNKELTEVEQFSLLPLGDVWDEAALLEPILYIYDSKKCR